MEKSGRDEEVRKCLVGIVRSTLPAAGLCVHPTRWSGLAKDGCACRSCVTASWFESRSTCGENWDRPQGCSGVYLPQVTASSEIDKASISHLINQSSPRDAQRLKRLDRSHAKAWITALPSTEDGKDTILAPRRLSSSRPAPL